MQTKSQQDLNFSHLLAHWTQKKEYHKSTLKYIENLHAKILKCLFFLFRLIRVDASLNGIFWLPSKLVMILWSQHCDSNSHHKLLRRWYFCSFAINVNVFQHYQEMANLHYYLLRMGAFLSTQCATDAQCRCLESERLFCLQHFHGKCIPQKRSWKMCG